MEVFADPHAALGSYRVCVISIASGETLAAWQLGSRAGGQQFRLIELHQQGIDRQALHALVRALQRLFIPLVSRMDQVIAGGLVLADLPQEMAGELATAN